MNNIESLAIKNITKDGTPLYMLGATSETSRRLLRILSEHSIKLAAIWDEDWLRIRHSDIYVNLRQNYKSAGYVVEPIPVDINAIPRGIIFIADQERYQRKWINYCNPSLHTIYDAQDVVLWPTYNSCAQQNADNPDLLKHCRNCGASYRRCPVRENWQETRYGVKKDKVIRHLAVKPGFICNLKCEYCCEFLPWFNETHKKLFDIDGLINDIQKLSSSLEYINLLSISGGDVMLNRGLAEVVRQVVKLENIGDIYALTNGTYLPHEDILDAIEKNRNRVRIVINNYAINKKAEKLTIELTKRSINHYLRDNAGWYNFNNLAFRNRSVNELKELYRRCSFDKTQGFYYIMTEGKLNLRCGIANSILYYLDKYNEHTQDYIDIRRLSPQEISNALTSLENRDYLDICNFCVGCKEESRTIAAAEDQIL